ncbi:Hpt domain-containing protein [Oryzibacter oryziterrae]|uniref:Hpt domain-containing protein n=1 Tax=Oryzibacter oryziterrae TaxID=2766474 RepID=UPI001F001C9C|nr:Hpt domain-containing protein [Oryzibacter oryziterrae]
MPLAAEATEYIEAKNDLRKKVREIRSRSPADDPVKRAETALQILSTHFDDWMKDEIEVMSETHKAWLAVGLRAGTEKQTFFRAVHDVKGQATTLGFPLASQVAGSLCNILERVDETKPQPAELIAQHVDAVRAIFREKAKDENDRIGSQLSAALIAVAKEYLAVHGIPEATDDELFVDDHE